MDRHRDVAAVSRQGFVNGIVDHLEDHMMQARPIVGVADVHAGALADGVKALEYLDRTAVVFVWIGNVRHGATDWIKRPCSILKTVALWLPVIGSASKAVAVMKNWVERP